jgi:hypothetical protein
MGVNEAGKDMVRLDNVKFEQSDGSSLSSDPLLLEQKPIVFRRNRPGTKAQVNFGSKIVSI